MENPVDSAYKTSIQITKEMLDILKSMKKYRRETMNDVLKRKIKKKKKK